MQAVELSTYNLEPTSISNSSLEVSSPKLPTNYTSPQATLENGLRGLFPQNTDETTLNKTRRTLGEIAKTLADEQIECMITEFQFLINSWLDEYEKDVFKGMTLKGVLNEK